ncbi:hypothetical protein [Myroides sp. N17-2]|uniref:hypothetical protein n=1 Tax=Myroides sp. N17-2 TaxID=2030799 RepID=UPI000EFAC20E|nr:hypothetical protein [Myroides sp. N17-2]
MRNSILVSSMVILFTMFASCSNDDNFKEEIEHKKKEKDEDFQKSLRHGDDDPDKDKRTGK